MRPEVDSPEACEMCRGTGAVAIGPWGVRPPKAVCPECDGSGWRLPLQGEIRKIINEMGLRVRKLTVHEGAGGNIEAAVSARLSYDSDPSNSVRATIWLDQESALTTPQYERYQALYRQRRQAQHG